MRKVGAVSIRRTGLGSRASGLMLGHDATDAVRTLTASDYDLRFVQVNDESLACHMTLEIGFPLLHDL